MMLPRPFFYSNTIRNQKIFSKLARGSVQMQGYCGDIDMKAFMEILEDTLGAPLSRKLEPTLTILKK